MEPAIVIKNISKKYTIRQNQGSYVALRDVVTNVFKNPFTSARNKIRMFTGNSSKEIFLALQDINFTINKGEVVGLIGHNGAGKSTLLKILSRITPPTTGEITVHGSIGSLLEVGTGFHPELTGRENIFLNGAILGMPQADIVRKFDEIVEFAGVQKFLDTPVKYYSSGMYVRLAFSVAAHMEPDILLIDEVLAVGDLEFQKKCLGKMEEITSQAGRTIVFVSHNLDAIQKLCTHTILLSQGKIEKMGPTHEVINHYLQHAAAPSEIKPHKLVKEFRIHSIASKNKNVNPWIFTYRQPLELEIELESFIDIPNFQLGIGINSLTNERVVTVHNKPLQLQKGNYTISINIENIFTPGSYEFGLDVLSLYYLPGFTVFHITDHDNNHSDKQENTIQSHELYNPGIIDLPATFSINAKK